jgi:hypothetical protein
VEESRGHVESKEEGEKRAEEMKKLVKVVVKIVCQSNFIPTL